MNLRQLKYFIGVVEAGKDEIPGAAGERYTQPASEVRPREVQDWLSTSSDSFGVTMSSSVAVCDYVDRTDDPVPYPVLQPLLLTSRKSCHGRGNWYLQPGDHDFRFSILSHEPGWKNGYRFGKQSNNPLRAVVAPAQEHVAVPAFLNGEGVHDDLARPVDPPMMGSFTSLRKMQRGGSDGRPRSPTR